MHNPSLSHMRGVNTPDACCLGHARSGGTLPQRVTGEDGIAVPAGAKAAKGGGTAVFGGEGAGRRGLKNFRNNGRLSTVTKGENAIGNQRDFVS